MRTKLTILLLISIAAIACRKEIVETKGGKGSGIGFTTLLTRGTAIDDAAGVANAGGFNVWAYSHTGSWSTALSKTIIIDNDVSGSYGHVTSADGITWDYGTPREWPGGAGEVVSFFAYAPAGSATVGYDVNEVPVVTYTVSSVIANQTDLLVANPVLDCTGPDPVTMGFSHALSRIHFSALKAPEVLEEIKITSVIFNNVYSEGSAPLQLPVVWDVDYTPGKVSSYTVSILNGVLNDVALTDAGQPISNGMLFLMPQTLLTDAEMTVTFTVDGEILSWTGVLAAPYREEWEPGKSYNYQLFIDGESVQVIVIDSEISLEDWEPEMAFHSVALGTDGVKNLAAIYSGISTFNTFKGNMVGLDEYTLFIIYAIGDLSHDLTINMSDISIVTSNFAAGDTLVFDFDESIKVWGTDSSNGDAPWEVEVINAAGWNVVPTPPQLTDRGTITLTKN